MAREPNRNLCGSVRHICGFRLDIIKVGNSVPVTLVCCTTTFGLVNRCSFVNLQRCDQAANFDNSTSASKFTPTLLRYVFTLLLFSEVGRQFCLEALRLFAKQP